MNMNRDDKGFQLFPDQASVGAEKLDQLYWFLVANAFFFTGLICVLILFFVWRYRRGSQADRTGAPTGNLGLELLWSFIPLTIMMISFGWGTKLFVEAHQPPPDAIEVYIVGKQWMWKVQHGEGRREINTLHVPTNQPVRLKMISEDVIHSFFIPAFRVKQDVLPGRYTHLWFEATKPGRYHLFCAEYCGTSHSLMRGEVVVMEPHRYADWVADQNVEPAFVAGRRLFERYRCDNCHGAEDGPRGPSLDNLLGKTVRLRNGETLIADVAYVRESILDPGARLVAGYQNLMPAYDVPLADQDALTEEQVLQLIAYIETLTK